MGELPDTFFDLTPRLYLAVVEGRSRKREIEFERMAWAVHQNAALCLSDPKKFPSLAKFIAPPKPRVRSNDAKPADHLMTVMAQWEAAMSARQ